MKRILILGTALAAVALTGCQTIKDEHQKILNRDETMTNIVGNVWRIDAKWPGVHQSNRLVEHLAEKARQHCAKDGKGMLPLRGASTNGTQDGKKPATAWLEFRCQNPLDYRPEYKGIMGSFEVEELTDLDSYGKN